MDELWGIIINDLKEACEKLTYFEKAEPGRVDLTAAHSLLAKVYLYLASAKDHGTPQYVNMSHDVNAYYNEAMKYAEKVVDNAEQKVFGFESNLLEIYNNRQNRGNIIQKKIYVDKYKIEDKVNYIINRMKNEEINYFEELIDTSECKLETIVTFLALLEMIKQRMVKVYQNGSFTKIIIERSQNIERN